MKKIIIFTNYCSSIFNYYIFHMKWDGLRDLPQLKPLVINELEEFVEADYFLKIYSLLFISCVKRRL